MKRLALSLLVMILLVSMALGGCQTATPQATVQQSASPVESASATTAAATPAAATPAPAYEATFPIVKDKISLSVFTVESDPAHPVKDSYYTKYYEDKTNIHIDWITTPQDGFVEKRNVVLASGDYPDILGNAWYAFSLDDIAKYSDQGAFLQLDDLINKYGMELKKIFTEDPAVKTRCLVNGKIFSLPTISSCYHCQYYQKVWYNKTLLDQLQLSVPTTTEEFYNTLLAIKQKDPKLIPYAGCKAQDLYTDPIPFLMGAFQYNLQDENNNFLPMLADLNKKTNKVQIIVNTDGFKQGLEYAQKLWKEGLIYNESFTQDANTVIRLNQSNGTTGSIVFVSGPHKGYFAGWEQTDKIWKNYHVLAPLTGPTGYRSTAWNKYRDISPGGVIITTACKYPDAAMKMLDWMYSFQGSMESQMGREGIEWSKPDAGAVGLDGKPALWKKLTPPTDDPYFQNSSWNQKLTYNLSYALRNGQQNVVADAYDYTGDDSNYTLEKLLFDATNEVAKYTLKDEEILPTLLYGSDIANDQKQLYTALGQYVQETMVKFVTTNVDIEAEWNNYLDQLKTMGLDTYVSRVQTAYDAVK